MTLFLNIGITDDPGTGDRPKVVYMIQLPLGESLPESTMRALGEAMNNSMDEQGAVNPVVAMIVMGLISSRLMKAALR